MLNLVGVLQQSFNSAAEVIPAAIATALDTGSPGPQALTGLDAAIDSRQRGQEVRASLGQPYSLGHAAAGALQAWQKHRGAVAAPRSAGCNGELSVSAPRCQGKLSLIPVSVAAPSPSSSSFALTLA
jgi:hypothetical protein